LVSFIRSASLTVGRGNAGQCHSQQEESLCLHHFFFCLSFFLALLDLYASQSAARLAVFFSLFLSPIFVA
jgi:hypothetical protein